MAEIVTAPGPMPIDGRRRKPARTLTLGRNLGADATEEDFDRWVAFVSDHIDRACGFLVVVVERRKGDVQEDAISLDTTDDERTTIEQAKRALWDDWCKGVGTPKVCP